jgi:hypothetical protein
MNAASSPTQPSSAEPRVRCQVRPRMYNTRDGMTQLGNVVLGHFAGAFLGAVVMAPAAHLAQRRASGLPTLVTYLPAFWLLVPGSLSDRPYQAGRLERCSRLPAGRRRGRHARRDRARHSVRRAPVQRLGVGGTAVAINRACPARLSTPRCPIAIRAQRTEPAKSVAGANDKIPCTGRWHRLRLNQKGKGSHGDVRECGACCAQPAETTPIPAVVAVAFIALAQLVHPDRASRKGDRYACGGSPINRWSGRMFRARRLATARCR